ncbi:Hypothetical predicted protein [Olea europaea subsp. europaea]|uniref:Uncharacterized protein n=1 Tax=Olea europaea subsp. europaea TaxID=158383 RepID=A0A8S0STS7_OLEEU|nr:Hypothetical predicted protein [Olea europaea subsp. europaea]
MELSDEKSSNAKLGFFCYQISAPRDGARNLSYGRQKFRNLMYKIPTLCLDSLLPTTAIPSLRLCVLPTRRRLKLNPSSKLYFPCNTSFFFVCYFMKIYLQLFLSYMVYCFVPVNFSVLAPGKSIIATLFEFVKPPDNNEKPTDQKGKVKFKIMSLKMNGPMDYIFDEQKDEVAVEQILRVVFLDVERPSPVKKLKRQLAEAEAEAEAELEARKKPLEDAGPTFIGEGLVIDEWKERRERYLARQQVEGTDSV